MKYLFMHLLFLSSSVFFISFIAVFIAIFHSYITKKYEGLLRWHRLLAFSIWGIVVALMFDPLSPSFMGEKVQQRSPSTIVYIFGDLLIYSLVLFFPIEFFDRKKWRNYAYISFLVGFICSILSPIIYRGELLRSSWDFGSFIFDLFKLLFVPTVFLYILHLRRITTKGTEEIDN